MAHGSALLGSRHGPIGPQVAAADGRTHHPDHGIGGLAHGGVGPLLHAHIPGAVHHGCSHQTPPVPYVRLVARWTSKLVASALICWMAALNPSGAAGTGHFGQVHLVDVPADDECWDRSGEAGLIVKRGGVRRVGRDRDGADHIIDEGDGHANA